MMEPNREMPLRRRERTTMEGAGQCSGGSVRGTDDICGTAERHLNTAFRDDSARSH
jgi:hypothetical protein